MNVTLQKPNAQVADTRYFANPKHRANKNHMPGEF